MKLFDTAIIIAGGKSVRMGFDKAFMNINNLPCIELIVKKLKKHFSEIIIVTDEGNKYNFLKEIVAYDQYKNAGPLGGLHAGLKRSSSLYNYLIACDMPVISENMILYMKRLLSFQPDIIACENKEFIEPFHAVYSKNLIELIEDQIKMGELSLFNLMKKSKTRVISHHTIRKVCKGDLVFTNLNTRQDLEYYQSYICFKGEKSWTFSKDVRSHELKGNTLGLKKIKLLQSFH